MSQRSESRRSGGERFGPRRERGRREDRRRPPRGLFADVLGAPDRDHCPGAVPVVSFRDDDDEEFLADLRERATATADLVRRGVWHGSWAALDPRGLVPPVPKRKELRALLAWRWHAARPVVLPGALAGEALAGLRRAELTLGAELARPGRLRAFVGERLGAGADDARPRFRPLPGEPPLRDPERDVERVLVAAEDGDGAVELWAKTGRLSTHAEDRSLRLRVSFGDEGGDDDSDDEARHALVAALGARLLPEMRLPAEAPECARLLRMFTGGDVLLTQPIAYWNAPGGGARFHHDAFRPEPGGQLGVVYAQLAGRTAWLALSTDDLAARVQELIEAVEAGALPWLPEELGAETWSDARRLVRDPARLREELTAPGCGRLGPLVDRGPETTSFLADAGHALLLAPGDVLLLPNHGFPRTALHSVFCASEGVAYGLSQAIRRAAPAEVAG